jgi:hypothetical protein
MIILCYHNGALGHSVQALIDCCTKEGRKDLPSFIQGKNLHHYKSDYRLFDVKHPDCDVGKEKKKGNMVVSASSQSSFGRLLILLMGLTKWTNKIPQFQDPSVYKQYGVTYGDQVEILSLTLLDKIKQDKDWFTDADHVFDVLDFWNNTENVYKFLKNLGLTPIKTRIDDFCYLVTTTNQKYFDIICKCKKIADDVQTKKVYDLDLTFYELVLCYTLLLNDIHCHHSKLKILTQHPTGTQELLEIFNE